jgi:hypothetical protein
MNKVKNIFAHYSPFINYLESKLLLVPNIAHIKHFTKDFLSLKSLCQDIATINEKVDQYIVQVKVTNLLSLADAIKQLRNRLTSLEYLSEINPQSIYSNYKPVFGVDSFEDYPDNLCQQFRELFTKMKFAYINERFFPA